MFLKPRWHVPVQKLVKYPPPPGGAQVSSKTTLQVYRYLLNIKYPKKISNLTLETINHKREKMECVSKNPKGGHVTLRTMVLALSENL